MNTLWRCFFSLLLASCASRTTSTVQDAKLSKQTNHNAQTTRRETSASVAMRMPTIRPAQASPASIAVEGGTLTVALQLSNTRFMVHEPVVARLVFSVENAATQASIFSGPPDRLGRPPGVEVAFRSSDGRALAQPAAEPGMNGVSGFRPVRPGQPVRELLLLSTYVSALVPGSYRLFVSTTVRTGSREVPVAIELPIEVIADNEAAMGTAIDALGTVALGTNFDEAENSVRVLHTVRDARVVPWWIRLSQVPNYSLRFAALRALGTWNEERAVQALVRASATAPNELSREEYTTEELRAQSAGLLRQGAAHALAENEHPSAVQALLAMRSSADSEVRLTVLHRAARLPRAQALVEVQAFERDASPVVRSEAQRYLAALRR